MAANDLIIQIPAPCSQSWHQMTPDGQGRFCAHCSKNVIDFTTLTDAQIVALLSQNKGSLCGRFENTQLNRVLTDRQLKAQSDNRFKEIFAALLLLVTTKEIMAGKPPVEKMNVVQTHNAPISGTEDKGDTTSLVTLQGKVIEKMTGETITEAVIENITRNTGKHSDSSGCFQIAAAIGDSIEISYIGYEKSKFVVKDFKYKTYALNESTLTGLTTITVYNKPTLADRIRHFFRIKHNAQKH